MFSKKNYYQVLQVETSSDPKQIKDNYYKLSKEFHPDVNKVTTLLHEVILALLKFYRI